MVFSIGFKGHPANVNAYKEKKTIEEQHSNNPVQLSFLDSLESQGKQNQVEYSSNTEKAKQNDSNIMMIDLTLKNGSLTTQTSGEKLLMHYLE